MTVFSDAWWWDLVPAALGAVVGAAAAAVPAYILASRASKEALDRDREARREHQKALAYRALVKLQALTNSVANVSRTIEETIVKANADGHGDLKTWQKVRPIAGLPSEVKEFDAEELALFVAGRRIDMINRLTLAVSRHNAILEQLRLYERLRTAYNERYPPVAAEGLRGTSYAAGPQVASAQLDSAALEELISAIRAMAAEDAESANELAVQFGPIMRELLDDATFPILQSARVDAVNTAQAPDRTD